MKRTMLTILAALFVSCGGDTVKLPDNKTFIDSNTLRIQLLEANDALQDLRLDALELTVADLESRLSQAESDIDSNESNILNLFSRTNYLAAGLVYLYNDLHYHVRELEATDRANRQLIRNKVRRLRRQLALEIRQRQLADVRLQSQIDDLESDLNSFEAQQSAINSFLIRGLAVTNFRISQLRNQVNSSLTTINNNISITQSQITTINNEISSINNEIALMETQITSIETSIEDIQDSVTSVVYPCGEGNSEEILLKTQNGIVAYFQETRNQTDSFQAGAVIPEHFICDIFYSGSGNSNRCKEGRNIPASAATSSVSITHQVLVKAYLDVLGDGNYRTTDGYSCNFTISNGEVQ